MTLKEWMLLVLLSLLWGLTFITAKILVGVYSPLGTVFWRVFIASCALLVIIKAMGIALPRTKEVWTAFIGMSILNNVLPMSLLFYGMIEISSSLSSILNATTPIFTVMAMHAFGAEKASRNKVIGVIIAMLGVIVLIYNKLELQGSAIAILASLGAALSYALSAVWGRKFKAMSLQPILIAWGQLTVSTVILLVSVLIFNQKTFIMPTNLEQLISLLIISLLSTAAAYIIFFKILNSAGGTNIMLVTFLVPVSAIFLGVTYLKEEFLLNQFIGMVIIGIGLAWIDGRLLQKFRLS